ncbi:MAG: glutathione S-transferase family protein [Pseudomonadota bacterium]
MLLLYDFGLSPFAQKVKIALREKGVAFERRNGLTGDGVDELRRLNRRGEVPLLVDGDVTVADSRIILDYIDERWPEPPLLPADPGKRAQSRMLEELCDTEIEALIYNLGELSFSEHGPAEARQAVAEFGSAELKRHQAELSKRLGDDAYFDGETIGRGDISVLPHMNASRVMRMAPEQDNMLAWLDRMNARPSVIETVAEVKQSLADFKVLMGAVKAGNTRRQMRDHRLDWLLRAGGAPILQARLAADDVRFSAA